MKTTDRVAGIIYATASVFSWGVYLPYAKLILAKLSPSVFLTFRLSIGAITLFVFSLTLRRSFGFKSKDLLWIITAGITGIILHQILQLESLKYTTATNVGWILTLIPAATGLFAWIFLKESIAFHQIVGLVIAMTGLALFVSKGNPTKLSFIKNYGDFLSFISIFTWAFYSIITKYSLSRYDAMPISTVHMALGSLFFFTISMNDIQNQITTLNTHEWIILILIGLIPSGLAYFWWNAGLKKLSAMNTSMFIFPEAVFASAAGHIVLGESFTLNMALFSAIIFTGVYVSVKGSPTKG